MDITAQIRAETLSSGAPVAYLAPNHPDRATEDAVIEQAMAILDRRLSREGCPSMTDPSTAGRYVKARLASREREVFLVLFLDCRHRLIAAEEMFHGTFDGSEVHPREVARRALALNAGAVILGHNHPSGHAEPSAADRAVTARLKQALALVEVRLLDHFVVAHGEPVSMAARGWI